MFGRMYKWKADKIIDGISITTFLGFIVCVRMLKGEAYLWGFDGFIAGLLIYNHLALIFEKELNVDDKIYRFHQVLFFGIVLITTVADLTHYQSSFFLIHIYLYAFFSVKYITDRKLNILHWLYPIAVVLTLWIVDYPLIHKFYYLIHFVILRLAITLVYQYVNESQSELNVRHLEQFVLIENAEEAFGLYKIVRHPDRGIVDAEILKVNKAFEILTGYSKEGLVGKLLNQTFTTSQIDWVDIFKKVVTTKETYCDMQYSKAIQKYVDFNVFYIDEDHVAVLLTDVSKAQQRERKLKNILDRFEMANDLKKQFMRDVNHRLRNPLNGMMGMMQLVEFEKMDEDNRELLESVLFEMRHVRNILNQISKYVEIQGMDFEFSKVNVFEVLKSIVNINRHPQCDVKFSELIKCPAETLYIEKNILVLSFGEVLRNAQKYTREGKVEIMASCFLSEVDATYYAKIEVRDFGMGIEKQQMELIFNEFYHHDFINVYREEEKVTLPMCKQMLLNSGGDLLVESEVGVGSVFTILLPVYND